MDSLVKSLIRPLLEEKQPGVAIIPGGFKPPTSGHFYLADEVAKRPEVEKAIVLIGHKDRDGITKDQSLAIWNIYKKYLPSNVSIEISEKSSPVSDVHSLIKHNPENFYLPVVGIRGEEDLNDIKRFDSLKGKYDNFEPVVVKSDSTEERMSGTNARKAILDGNFESFQRFLPVELSDEDRETIWNVLTGETINEGLISKHLETLKSKFKEFVKALKQEKQETKDAFKLLVQAVKNEKELSKEEKKQIGDQLKDVLKVAGFTAASILPGGIIYIMLTKIPALKKSLTPSAFINEGIDTRFDKVKFYFDYYTNVSPSTFEIVIEENNIKIGNIVEPYPSNFDPENVRQIPVNQNLEENIDPKAQSKHKGKAAPFGSAYKPVKEKKGFDKKLGKDPYGINQFARELLERSVDKTMYAEPSKFSYPTAMSSLIQHMLSKGMNIRPLPKVKFIDNDEENAQNFFGKTAYYNPDAKEITLFTMDRHPKDIMRSFAHEMIHHEQNCNGKLDNIQTQNTNEEGDLPEIEREAYEKGNMAFRNWTDSITEIKDPFGLVEFVKETFKENITEGRYDKISNQISSEIFTKWKEDYDNAAEASRFEKYYEFNNEELFVDANISFIPELGGLRVDGGANDEEDYIEVRFEIDPEKLPEFWEEISMNLKDVIRHEIEHLTHGEGLTSIPTKRMSDDVFIRQMIDIDLLSRADYFKLKKEIDANLQGMYYRAKKEKRPFIDVINTYLDAQDITSEEKEEIIDLWRSRLSALNLPKF